MAPAGSARIVGALGISSGRAKSRRVDLVRSLHAGAGAWSWSVEVERRLARRGAQPASLPGFWCSDTPQSHSRSHSALVKEIKRRFHSPNRRVPASSFRRPCASLRLRAS
eukprot:3052691-Prymnesium_polylepis.1